MLKISRAYLDACGYFDGVFEELLVKPSDASGLALHHVIHAPNGVGKTTILALLFSIFEPDRRKFLRTEINRQHKIEHYFMPGRLGVVALELVKPGVNNKPVHHVVGQVFWLTPASKGEDGEPGHRRFFAFQSDDEATLDTLPFRGLSGGTPLRSLDDFTRWARDMRAKPTFFATDSLTAWRKHLTSELGIELKVIEVQRRFCAAEGGIGAAFLDFKSEQQFLEKIFSFMIPSDAAESVVQALETGLAKIRGLPQRKDQLKVLTELDAAFAPFFAAAAALETAETGRADDFTRLGRLFSRFKLDQTKLQVDSDTVGGEIAIKEQNLEGARSRERMLHGEILFLEKAAADRRISDAKALLERSNANLATSSRRLRSARAADVGRKLSSAQRQKQEFEAELERIEHDLAPDRAFLARAGANLHALLEQLAAEAERDAATHEQYAAEAQHQAELQEAADREATSRAKDLKAEIERLAARVAEHDHERKELERTAALKAGESPSTALARLDTELRTQGDAAADLELQDEQREKESRELEGVRTAALADTRRCAEEADRLAKSGEAGRALEQAVLDSEALTAILPGEAKDPYRTDLPERAKAARAVFEETHRKLATERAAIADELNFLEAEGVSSVPGDVALVARALKDAGISNAQPAEHYLAQFKPDAEQALELLRNDPARFGGVFVARLDRRHLSTLASESRLKLKGPVVVSEATLQSTATPATETGVVFGPFSAARVNKQAAAEEKARLGDALAQKETQLRACAAQIEALRSLIDNLRDLHTSYRHDRPDNILRRSETFRADKERADQRAKDAVVRQEAVTRERAQLRLHLRTLTDTISRLKMAKQTVDQFSRRYPGIAEMPARIPVAAAEQRQQQDAALKARAAANEARATATERGSHAVGLRASAQARRSDKAHYPETDGGAADRTGTLDDLRSQYKTAEHALASKRDARQATVWLQLTGVKESILRLEPEYAAAIRGLADSDLEPYAAVADLARAIQEAEQAEQQCHSAVARADATLTSAQSALGPVSGKIERAEKKNNLKPIPLPEFAHAPAELCASEAALREQQAEALESDIRAMERDFSGLRTRHNEIKDRLSRIQAFAKRAEGHLPETSRNELADLSLAYEALEPALDEIINRLGEARATISRLEEEAEALFDEVRQLIEGENFRRLEPQVADHLRRYSHCSAGAERATLQARIAERIGIVRGEIENQIRDQNACLEQLRLHVIHADELLHRAARCSKIPDHIAFYGGERILKIKRRLRELASDMVRNQLSIWLDELVLTGRVPPDGALLAAELLNRVHAGRALEIEILKPKRDAIQPYMRVDRMGLSGGEGVTVAMMLYTVIQKMAMDERADGKNAASGGFLILDNTYGMSNMMEHIVLQKTMADLLDIQLFVTTCSEDKHVLNMFPTITRLVQGERVLQDGHPKYIRVRSADYLLKGTDRAA
jgi:chromosome segregation ATPase